MASEINKARRRLAAGLPRRGSRIRRRGDTVSEVEGYFEAGGEERCGEGEKLSRGS